MSLNSLAICIIGLIALCGLALSAYSAKAAAGRQAHLRRLRESPQYQQFHEKMAALRRYDIDQIRIESSGVTVTSVCPAHSLLLFPFKQNGNCKRNGAYTMLYAELIAQDFPLFTQRSAYKISRYNVWRTNGKPEVAYAFVMRRGYKDFLLAERCPSQLRIY